MPNPNNVLMNMLIEQGVHRNGQVPINNALDAFELGEGLTHVDLEALLRSFIAGLDTQNLPPQTRNERLMDFYFQLYLAVPRMIERLLSPDNLNLLKARKKAELQREA